MLVSAGYAEDDQVVARHAAVIDAAVRDGVTHVAYTSLTTAGDHLAFAVAHRVTEKLVRDSGLGWTLLRNGLYAELFGGLLLWTDGGLESAFGTGALSAVARQDLASAAAIVAAAPAAHEGKTYELVGHPITADDVADRLSVTHTTISLGEYRARLLASDELLPFQPPMLASIATSIRHGFLSNTSPDLRSLLGRPLIDPLTVAAGTAASLRASAPEARWAHANAPVCYEATAARRPLSSLVRPRLSRDGDLPGGCVEVDQRLPRHLCSSVGMWCGQRDKRVDGMPVIMRTSPWLTPTSDWSMTMRGLESV